MGDKSKIEWTDASWNPVTGCTKVSAGCQNCYAERLADRFYRAGTCAISGAVIERETDFSSVLIHPNRITIPLHWRKPRRIFVCSVGDLFHPQVNADFITQVFEVMSACPQHTFQVLTKRPERIEPVLFGEEGRFYLGGGDYLPNVWLGVSAENQQEFDLRIPILLATGWTGIKWVSIEPMLGPVDLTSVLWYQKPTTLRTPRLEWVVVGGESGPKARPMHPEWALSVRDQCVEAGVPFLFKQWGEWGPVTYYTPWRREHAERFPLKTVTFEVVELDPGAFLPGPELGRIGKKSAGRLLDGTVWDQFPELKADG
jgi:protein gp37